MEETKRKLPGQEIRYVFTGQSGVSPRWRWVTLGLLDPLFVFIMRPRIVAVTKDSIIVLSTGAARWHQKTPHDALETLPRTTILGPPKHGRWTLLHLGSHRVWVSRAVYPAIEKANAEIASDVAGAGSSGER